MKKRFEKNMKENIGHFLEKTLKKKQKQLKQLKY